MQSDFTKFNITSGGKATTTSEHETHFPVFHIFLYASEQKCLQQQCVDSSSNWQQRRVRVWAKADDIFGRTLCTVLHFSVGTYQGNFLFKSTHPPHSPSFPLTLFYQIASGVRERECCFNKQSRCGGDYLTPAVWQQSRCVPHRSHLWMRRYK